MKNKKKQEKKKVVLILPQRSISKTSGRYLYFFYSVDSFLFDSTTRTDCLDNSLLIGKHSPLAVAKMDELKVHHELLLFFHRSQIAVASISSVSECALRGSFWYIVTLTRRCWQRAAEAPLTSSPTASRLTRFRSRH